MPGVFISYRREDSSGYAGRLFDILSDHFGKQNTFMDIDTIQGGDDFSAVIEEKVKISDVLVAVIGGRWLTVTDANGARRLDNPKDFVRLEVGRALARGIRVIPVLVGGAVIPKAEDLPPDLQPLCERQAVEVRDAHFHADADQLIEILHKALHGVSYLKPELKDKRVMAAVISGIGVLVLVAGLLRYRHAHMAAANVVVAAVQPAAIAGKWTAVVKYDWGDTHTEAFNFELDGSEVSGTASFLGVDGEYWKVRSRGTGSAFSPRPWPR